MVGGRDGQAPGFEPGRDRTVVVVPFAGGRRIFGVNGLVNGELDALRDQAMARARERGFAAGASPA